MSLNRFSRHGLWNLAASTAGIALAAVAFAGDRDPRGPEFPISVAEARERAEARFTEIDTDGNEEISRAEFDAAPLPHHAPGGRHRPFMWQHQDGSGTDRTAMEAELFQRLDDDGDGQLSPEEFSRRDMRAAGRDMMREHMFDALDADGDGSLSRDELPDMAGRLAEMDEDGDGLVTRTEARAHHRAMGESRRANGTDTSQ